MNHRNVMNVMIAKAWSAGMVARTRVDLMTCGCGGGGGDGGVCRGGGLLSSSGRLICCKVLHQSHAGLASLAYQLARLLQKGSSPA